MPVEIKELIVRAIIDPKKEKAVQQSSSPREQKPLEANVLEEQIRNFQQLIEDKNER